MAAPPFAPSPSPDDAPPADASLEADELVAHASSIGTSPDLIKIQASPESVSVAITKPDGRTVRRVVPRECWDDHSYRSSLMRDMGSLLA